MPWERDGRTWHTVNHVDHKGVPVEWDPDLLIWLVETLEKSGPFAPTDWNHRSRVEMKAPGSQPWLCHILTGGKDLLEVAIRVESGTFTVSGLRNLLNIKTLDERSDLPIYGQWERIRVRSPVPGWQEVRLFLRDFVDVDRRVFRAVLKKSAESYLRHLDAARADPDRAEPWKTQGLHWHMSQKSIRPGQPIRWSPTFLMSLIGRLKSLQPGLEFAWNARTSGQFHVPGEDQPAGKIVTNMARGLRVEVRAPKNSITPVQIDRLGEKPEIKPQDRYDRVVFWVRSLAQINGDQLRQLWRRCRKPQSKEVLRSA
jgi:excinuclease ABC subunit A